MKTSIVCCAMACLALTACSSNPSRTYRGDLLDDKVTTQRVQLELSRAGSDFKNVHVFTTNGVVTLSGNVESPEIRSRAEEIARNTHRDADIKDDLQVQK
jgi:osmotically-inducible protein OsmY